MSRSLIRLSVIRRHMLMDATAIRLCSTSSPTATDDVIIEKVKGKGLITLNRPSALNALNLSMARKMQPVLEQWQKRQEVSCVIIRGAGGKAFCAGGDIRAIADARNSTDKSIQRDFFREEYILNHTIGTLNVPWVAFIDGITMGGGVGLSVHGKFRIATERTLFAMPETAIGLFPDVGGGYFLPRLGTSLGTYLALTGYRLKGRDVLHAGVATHFVDSDKIKELEGQLLDLNPCNASTIGEILRKYQDMSKVDADKPFSLLPHLDGIADAFDSSTVEEILDRLRTQDSDWSRKQISTIEKMSPTSLKVTLRQLREGARAASLADDLAMEYRLSQRFMLDKDFFEGVRAVIIDKGQSPRWNPATLSEVTDAHVDAYFAPLPPKLELKL